MCSRGPRVVGEDLSVKSPACSLKDLPGLMRDCGAATPSGWWMIYRNQILQRLGKSQRDTIIIKRRFIYAPAARPDDKIKCLKGRRQADESGESWRCTDSL